MKGYLPPNKGGAIIQNDPSQEILHDLGMRKQNLLLELSNYQENQRLALSSSPSAEIDRENLGVIPVGAVQILRHRLVKVWCCQWEAEGPKHLKFI